MEKEMGKTEREHRDREEAGKHDVYHKIAKGHQADIGSISVVYDFCEWLRAEVVRQGISPYRLAKLSYTTTAIVHKYMKEDVNPSLYNARQICSVLGYDLLIEGTDVCRYRIFPRWLTETAREKEFTKAHLARAAGVSVATIDAYMRGKQTPSLRFTGYICEALGVEIHLASKPAPKRIKLGRTFTER